MRLTVLGGCGAWPDAGQACSGYLVEHDGFRLLVDAGYAVVPRLLSLVAAADVDAVYISHGHPDHCADLSPLLRARVYTSAPAPLPVYAPAGALTAVLALDNPRVYAGAFTPHDLDDGMTVDIGPFRAHTRLLPHWVPNLGVRLSAGGRILAYTGDTGPSPSVVSLADGADVLLAEATHLSDPPADVARYLSTATLAGSNAAAADVGRLLLTHLWPGTPPADAVAEAAAAYSGPVAVATPDLVVDLA
jgi:ribonuclease BN (tRNA processing enzyme)